MKLNILNPQFDRDEIRQICERLSSQAAISYFLTWGWIENWLDCLDKTGTEIKFYSYSKNSVPLCAFFAGARKGRRHGIIKFNNIYLNTTGISEFDELCIEYNSMLYNMAETLNLHEVISRLPMEWDEIIFPALSEELFPGLCMQSNQKTHRNSPWNIIVDRIEPTPYVSLEQVRNEPGGYIPLLGKNTRYNLRKSYKIYKKQGPVSLIPAVDKESALDIYEELVQLHQKSWTDRGYPGAFASAFFYDFHKKLITKRFNSGEIQLISIRCGEKTIGCLYNFIHQGIVLQYQSGINYFDLPEKNAHPGFVCYAECINYNAELKHSIFDFMAGSLEYKQRLSTHQKNILWARIQKTKLKFSLERKMEFVYRWLKDRKPVTR